jgi:hypothetical protein
VYRAFKTKERCVAVDAKWIIKLTGCLLDAWLSVVSTRIGAPAGQRVVMFSQIT